MNNIDLGQAEQELKLKQDKEKLAQDQENPTEAQRDALEKKHAAQRAELVRHK